MCCDILCLRLLSFGRVYWTCTGALCEIKISEGCAVSAFVVRVDSAVCGYEARAEKDVGTKSGPCDEDHICAGAKTVFDVVVSHEKGEPTAKAKELTVGDSVYSCCDYSSPRHSYSVFEFESIRCSSVTGSIGTVPEMAESDNGDSLSSVLTLTTVGCTVA